MIKIREYTKNDTDAAAEIWNEVVKCGNAFPQESCMNYDEAYVFFSSQTFCGIAEDENGSVLGLYILHPNNVGRCGHLCNASYAVCSAARGLGIGELLVRHCILEAPKHDFKILQFNAVVANNLPALNLYKKLGFTPLGAIPGGFRMPDNTYADIIPHYIVL